jgi:predicted unusual protein kinase regulating ubiquinone biosynthesis (AarF/ABC1/UbiB family)
MCSRPDLLPPPYLLEFEKLQDRIPPFSNEKAFARECVSVSFSSSNSQTLFSYP